MTIPTQSITSLVGFTARLAPSVTARTPNHVGFEREGSGAEHSAVASHTKKSKSSKWNILLEAIEIEKMILGYLEVKDMLSFRLVSKMCQKSYLTHLQPRIYKKDLYINKQNIKNGELYFPPMLSDILIAEDIGRRADGLLLIDMYLQKVLDTSRTILEPTIDKVKKDIDGNMFRRAMIWEKRDEKDVWGINELYQDILSMVWRWENVFPHFSYLLETPSLITLDMPPLPEPEDSLNKCMEHVKNLKDYTALSPLSKGLHVAGFLYISAAFFALVAAVVLASVAMDLLVFSLALAYTMSFLFGCILGLGGAQYLYVSLKNFEYYYKFPRALERLNWKLDFIKNSFYIDDTQSAENGEHSVNARINIADTRHKYLVSHHNLLYIPDLEVNQSVHHLSQAVQFKTDESVAQETRQQKLIKTRESIRVFLQAEVSFQNKIRAIAPKPSFFSSLLQKMRRVSS